jgi:ADP-ribose pyrophosphatase YjhB (NUDIX family)
MARIVYGERAGQQGHLAVTCCAVIYGADRGSMLLTRRHDNGRWCLPGGFMEAGESVVEACAREVWEETGLRVRIGKLIGVYSSPDYLLVYADGNRYQAVRLCFEAAPIGGHLGLSTETSEARYVSLAAMVELDVMETHQVCIADAQVEHAAPFMR